MFSNLFSSSTIPMLEQVVKFTQARHGVLAGNIANIDTPGYKSRDLSVTEFQERLKIAVEQKHASVSSPGHLSQLKAPKDPEEHWKTLMESTNDFLYHDDHDVHLETQITEISKNHAQHNMALSLMNSQFQTLRTAISERV